MQDNGRICTGLLAVTGLLAAVGCREANEFQPPPPPKVTVAKPLVQTVVTYSELPGRTRAIESVEVRARVEGFLRSVDFTEGSTVEEGDLLYTIEPERYAAEVKAAEARLANARATLEKKAFDHERMKRLQADEAASDVEVIEAKTDFDKANAEVMAAGAALESARLDLAYTRVTAPIAGYVNRTEVNVGNLVGRGEQTVLTTIVPWDPIHVYVTIGERDVLEWRRRLASQVSHLTETEARREIPVFLQLADGTMYPTEGRVDYVDNQVDVNTGTLRARAVFANPDRLIVPGIFVRARVPREPEESVLVPEIALQRDLVGYFVFTVDAAGEVARVDVEAGPKVESYLTVTEGLTGEERVIILGLQRVQPGVVVDADEIALEPVQQFAGAGGAGDANAAAAAAGDASGNS
jgi:RND family efflux transporter MFP subunit